MKCYLDTSVLIPALLMQLPEHATAFDLLIKMTAKPHKAVISTHTLAECYSVLTAFPLRPKIHPMEAQQMIEENIIQRCTIAQLTENDYVAAIELVSRKGLTSGAVYDALHWVCSQRMHCDRLYTKNTRHFQMLAGSKHDKIIRVC